MGRFAALRPIIKWRAAKRPSALLYTMVGRSAAHFRYLVSIRYLANLPYNLQNVARFNMCFSLIHDFVQLGFNRAPNWLPSSMLLAKISWTMSVISSENFSYLAKIWDLHRVSSPNTGCLLNIGYGPRSGPPLYSKAEGRFTALHFIMGRRTAKRPISF